MNAITIGLDIAKSVFQVHGEDACGKVVIQKRLRRSQVEAFFAQLPPSLVGIEPCGSSHHWGRTLRAQDHEVRLIPAAYVKPFVRRDKTDARDAAAICAAWAVRTCASWRSRASSSRRRAVSNGRGAAGQAAPQLMNCVRSQLAEFGIVAAQGRRGFAELAAMLEAGDATVPPVLSVALRALTQQIEALRMAITALEQRIMAVAKEHPVMRRLAGIPGVGGITAHAIVAAVGDGRQFGSARDFAAWAGLTPRQHSSAGKRRDQGISRQGDIRLRKLFALGASTILRNVRSRADRATAWQRGILARRPVKVAVLAQAAKTARIAWAILVSGETWQARNTAVA